MNVLLEAAIGAVTTKYVANWMNSRTSGKTDTVVDPIAPTPATNPQPQQPMGVSTRDTNTAVVFSQKAIPLILRANGPQMGDPVPGTAQIISAPSGKLPAPPGRVSTTIFAQQTDPADAGNVSAAPRATSFYLDPITGNRIPILSASGKYAGMSGGQVMLQAEHDGTPAGTINDPSTAPVQASLLPGSLTLAPGIQPKILSLNPTQKIPVGASWAEGVYV